MPTLGAGLFSLAKLSSPPLLPFQRPPHPKSCRSVRSVEVDDFTSLCQTLATLSLVVWEAFDRMTALVQYLNTRSSLGFHKVRRPRSPLMCGSRLALAPCPLRCCSLFHCYRTRRCTLETNHLLQEKMWLYAEVPGQACNQAEESKASGSLPLHSAQLHLVLSNTMLLNVNVGNKLAHTFRFSILSLLCNATPACHVLSTSACLSYNGYSAANTEAFAHRRCRAVTTRFKLRQGALAAILSLSIFVQIGPEPVLKVNVALLCLSIGCALYSECKERQHRSDSEPPSPWSPVCPVAYSTCSEVPDLGFTQLATAVPLPDLAIPELA